MPRRAQPHPINVTMHLTPLYETPVTAAAIDRAIAIIDHRLVIRDGVFRLTVAGFDTDIPDGGVPA